MRFYGSSLFSISFPRFKIEFFRNKTQKGFESVTEHYIEEWHSDPPLNPFWDEIHTNFGPKIKTPAVIVFSHLRATTLTTFCKIQGVKKEIPFFKFQSESMKNKFLLKF